MAEIDHNTIKPVESLHNIGGITPTKRREERKKRQNLNEQNQEQQLDEDQLNESSEENTDREIAEKGRDDNSIDYCA